MGRVRASDAERDEVLARLREEFAAGRLSHDTFLLRMDAVLRARHVSDLPPLLADLVPAEPLPPPRTGLRATLDRWGRAALTVAAGGAGRARAASPRNALRRTGAMTRAAAEPTPLQFPRGVGAFYSIGRNVGCDLAIADMTVSRLHARLERTGDRWLLTDLGSTNGTRVNGWRVRGHVQVKAGDRVSFGQAEFWLTAPEAI